MANVKEKSEQTGAAEVRRRRMTTVIILSVLVLLLMLSLIAQSGFNISPLVSPDTASETLLLYSLSTLNFLAFITLFFVLLRNVIKLVRERRANKLGSKFKARLVSYAIGLSLLPVLLLFFFSFGLLNRSVDRWFGEPARQIAGDAQHLGEGYLDKEQQDLAQVTRIAGRDLALASRTDFSDPEVERQIRRQMGDSRLAAVVVAQGGARLMVAGGPPQGNAGSAIPPGLQKNLDEAESLLKAGQDSYAASPQLEGNDRIYTIAGIRVSGVDGNPRFLLAAREFPPELTRRLGAISDDFRYADQLRRGQKGIKDIYILLLAAVALLLIFAAIWLALHLARGITVPIQALAEATDRVAHGDFSGKVEVPAEDELATLVNSFNQMASQLAESRAQVEQTAEDLRKTNLALDDRRRYIERILESLSTGVVSVDADSTVSTINEAALAIFGLGERPAPGTPISDLARGRAGTDLASLCRRAGRGGMAQAELEFERADGSRLHTATAAIALRNMEEVVVGWVIVVEDLTNLIQAERAAAWSEVARRMAHEIKNPLTPIQLWAERILRTYQRGLQTAGPARFEDIVTEGTGTIIKEVGTLQRMVEEFSRFARLPEARLVKTSVNDVVEGAVKLYDGRLGDIRLESHLADELPSLELDPEQIKRVLVNLIDNAIEALTVAVQDGQGNGKHNGAGAKLITIESTHLKTKEVVRLIVSDTGHGIRPADRDKLFLPKFSTRDRGTGLGLAIVSHIVSDHKGRIRVEDNLPRGARFMIDLPVG